MSYDTANKGTLGKNHRKEKDTHPTHTGKCDIGGKQYWISAWVKDGNNNEKFFSLSFQPKDEQTQATPRPAARQSDDDIPFIFNLLECDVEPGKVRRLRRASF